MENGERGNRNAARAPGLACGDRNVRGTLGWLALGVMAVGAASLSAARPAAAQLGGDEYLQLDSAVTRINSLPYTITECGRYVVTRCLQGVAGQNGITVRGVSDVTINLNGFTLSGVPGSLDGIRATDATNIVVRNGTVRDWGGAGVYLGVGNSRVSHLQSCGNGSFGIRALDEAFIDRCLVSRNESDGIRTNRCAVVTNCVSTLNSGSGIVAGMVPNFNSGSIVRSSSACFNVGYGIRIAPAGLVADCAIVQNGGGAIDANNALVRGNSASGSIDATSSTVIENHQY